MLGALPRSAKIKPAVGEFGRSFALHNFTNQDLAEIVARFFKGAKILSRHVIGASDPGDCLADLAHSYKAVTLVRPEQISALAQQYEWRREEDKAILPPALPHGVGEGLVVDWLALSENGNAAERFAERLLKKRAALSEEILELADLLQPTQEASESGFKSWCSGTLELGAVLAPTVRKCKNTTILIASIARAACSSKAFSAVVLSWGPPNKIAQLVEATSACETLVAPISCVQGRQACVFASCATHIDRLQPEERLLLAEVGFVLQCEHSVQGDPRLPDGKPGGGELCVVGVPCSPEEFVHRAVSAGHQRVKAP